MDHYNRNAEYQELLMTQNGNEYFPFEPDHLVR